MDAGYSITTFYTLKHGACYTFFSCMFLVFYDALLTLGQEVELIWHSSISIPALVYFISRYSSFIFSLVWLLTKMSGPPTVARCVIMYHLSTWSSWASSVLVHLAVQVWLYAMFNKNRHLMYGLATIFIILAALQFSACFLAVRQLRVIQIIPVCVTVSGNLSHGSPFDQQIMQAERTKMSTFLMSTVLASMAFSVFLMTLLAYRAFVTYRPSLSRPHDIASVLVRDSAIYCLVILFVTIYNALLITIAPPNLLQAGVGFEIALPAIASSRLLLNLRAADKRRERRTNVNGMVVDQWETLLRVTI